MNDTEPQSSPIKKSAAKGKKTTAPTTPKKGGKTTAGAKKEKVDPATPKSAKKRKIEEVVKADDEIIRMIKEKMGGDSDVEMKDDALDHPDGDKTKTAETNGEKEASSNDGDETDE